MKFIKKFFHIYNIIYIGLIIVIFIFVDYNPSLLKNLVIGAAASAINIVGFIEGRNRNEHLNN